MVHDKTLLYNIRLLEAPILITLPDGNKVKVYQYGDLKIGRSLTLHHALLVPNFQFNLLSVKRLSEQLKCEVVFSEHACVLQGLSLKRPLVIGRSVQGLYILDEVVSKGLEAGERNGNTHSLPQQDKKEDSRHLYSFSCNKDSVSLWHNRIGYISFKKLSHMSMLKNFSFNKDLSLIHI